MPKLDELLAALSDDSPWSMKAAEVLDIPNSEIRDLLLEYVQRHERAQWFGPSIKPPAGKMIIIETNIDGMKQVVRGSYFVAASWSSADNGWVILSNRYVCSHGFLHRWLMIPESSIIGWRYLPEYPEGGE